ncbi:unnamed protein product [Bathycoccus prasinos]
MTGSFVEFFAHLSEEKINHLYTISPWATLALLRALTPLAKQYIMRCVFLPLHSVIAHEMLASWTKRGCETAHEMAIERGFEDLGGEEEEEKENEGERGEEEEEGEQDAGFLDHYAKSRWETVLLELASEASVEKKRKKKKMMKKKGDGGAGAQHALHLRKLFYAARLITKDGRITSEGFSFLLGAASEQIWILLARYARGGGGGGGGGGGAEDFEKKMKNKTTNEENGEGDKMETNGEDEKQQHKLKSDESSAAAMAFLVRLSFQHPGANIPKRISPRRKDAWRSHLSALGVLYENEDDENDNNWYVPTVLSAGLSSVSTTSSAKSALARIDGHIIVEANFRVYGVHTL